MHRNQLRFVDSITDPAAQPDSCMAHSSHFAVNLLSQTVCQHAIDFTDMAYRILSGGGFGTTRSVKGNNSVHLIAPSDFAGIGILSGSSKHRKINAGESAAAAIQSINPKPTIIRRSGRGFELLLNRFDQFLGYWGHRKA